MQTDKLIISEITEALKSNEPKKHLINQVADKYKVKTAKVRYLMWKEGISLGSSPGRLRTAIDDRIVKEGIFRHDPYYMF